MLARFDLDLSLILGRSRIRFDLRCEHLKVICKCELFTHHFAATDDFRWVLGLALGAESRLLGLRVRLRAYDGLWVIAVIVVALRCETASVR